MAHHNPLYSRSNLESINNPRTEDDVSRSATYGLSEGYFAPREGLFATRIDYSSNFNIFSCQNTHMCHRVCIFASKIALNQTGSFMKGQRENVPLCRSLSVNGALSHPQTKPLLSSDIACGGIQEESSKFRA